MISVHSTLIKYPRIFYPPPAPIIMKGLVWFPYFNFTIEKHLLIVAITWGGGG